jgi:hypothetical protein
MSLNIKLHVQAPVHFRYYRDSALWYETAAGLLFPVPISDIGTTTFNASEKGILMMRWIRKYLMELEAAGSAA